MHSTIALEMYCCTKECPANEYSATTMALNYNVPNWLRNFIDTVALKLSSDSLLHHQLLRDPPGPAY